MAATTPMSEAAPSTLRPVLIVIGCALGLCFNIATVFNGTLTTFIKPIVTETGWTRAEISLGLSIAMGTLLLMLPWTGRLCDRVGPRRVIAAGAPLLSIALASLAWAPPNYPLYLACCALMGIVAAATYNSVFYALLPHFFDRRLGLAVGIVSAGTGLGLMLGPLASQALISMFGWRGAYLALALATAAVVVPASLLLLRDPTRLATGRAADGVSSAAAWRSLRFWHIASTYFLTGLAINGAVVHLVPLLTDQGMTPQQAALLASYLGFGVLAARLISGLLLDHVDAGLLGAISFMLAAAGMLLLTIAPSDAVSTPAVLLIGAALGAEGGILTYVTRRVFGIQAYGAVVGAMMSTFLAGVLIGPLISGAAYDVSRTYDPVLYVFAALCALAAALHARVTLGVSRLAQS
jgi:MFS transporter, OFA family, oxalate/formate antiporter